MSRAAVDSGELDQFGDRVFTDARVRKALAELATDLPDSLTHALATNLGPPAVSDDAIKRSLARILDLPAAVAPSVAPHAIKSSSPPAGLPVPPKGQEYPLDHHLGNKSSLIRELFEEVDKYAGALGADVTRRVRKQYIAYFRGKKSYFTAEIQQRRIIIYLNLEPQGLNPWNAQAMRDATNIGHFGMGDTEYSLRTEDQLPEARVLVKAAYDAT